MRRDVSRPIKFRAFRPMHKITSVERLETRCVLSGSSISVPPVAVLPSKIDNGIAPDTFVAGPQSGSSDQNVEPFGAAQSHRGNFGQTQHTGMSAAGIDSLHGMQSPMTAGSDVIFFVQPMAGGFYGDRYEVVEILIVPNSSVSMNRAVADPFYGSMTPNARPDENLFGESYGNFAPPPGPQSHQSQQRENDFSGAAPTTNAVISEASSTASANQQAASAAHFAALAALPTSVSTAQSISPVVRSASLVLSRTAQHAVQSLIESPSLVTTTDSKSVADAAAVQNAALSTPDAHFRPAIAATLSTDAAIDFGGLKINDASLIGIPLNLRGVERALNTVMTEIESLSTHFTGWLSDVRLSPLVVVVTAAALGGGTAYYLRRRGSRQTDRLDDEASSSWLFLRMQPIPGE